MQTTKILYIVKLFLLILNLIFLDLGLLLGIGVAFIPIIYKYRMKMIFHTTSWIFLIRKKDELYLIRKLSKEHQVGGILIYALKEVIPKYLFLGVGSGVSRIYRV